MVTVRQKATGVILKINLAEMDETMMPVVPDVNPAPRPATKRELDRAIWRSVMGNGAPGGSNP